VREQWPSLEVKQVAFEDIQQSLPATTKKVLAEQRQEQALMRMRHVQRRYRQY